ncbi:MAG: S9 family peptidase [Chloroflexi bacterium]|nr:S9 family peptidase [Chloroflexota bacterium]
MPKRPITIEDLAQIKGVGDPRISPDGARVLYTVKIGDVDKNKYYSHLWTIPTAGGNARQFTFGEVSDTSPRWSPEGGTIAFIRNKDRRTQIWLAALDGGEPRALTNLPEGAIGDLRWSPGGVKLAFTFRPAASGWTRDAAKQREENGKSKPPRVIARVTYRLDGAGFQDERQHVWVCDVASGAAKAITTGDFDNGSPAWSPTGDLIAFASARGADALRNRFRNDIYTVPARGGAARKVAAYDGSKSQLEWSPDGQWIACFGSESGEIGWRPKNTRLFIVAARGGASGRWRCLSAELDRSVGDHSMGDVREGGNTNPIWSPDGKQIFVTVSDSGNDHIYAADVASGTLTRLHGGAGSVSGLSADQAVRSFAILHSDPSHPGEVFAGALKGVGRKLQMAVRPLTHANREWLASVEVSKPREFWLTQADGTKVQGWVIPPPSFNPKKQYPAVVYVHGGPHGQYANTFFHEMQAHAARGYVVLMSNPRGSNGRDEEYGACIHRDWGNLDYADVMSVADYGAALPYVDADRMAIAGGSYGGFMTNWAVGHTRRFRCAITDRSICNWMSMVGTTDMAMPPEGLWPGSPVGDEIDLGWQLSPLRYVQNVRTPMLVIHSEGDLRCPIAQSEEWFTALKFLKQEAVFVRYPVETSHGMSRGGPIDLRFDRLQRIGDWLDKYLKPKRR